MSEGLSEGGFVADVTNNDLTDEGGKQLSMRGRGLQHVHHLLFIHLYVYGHHLPYGLGLGLVRRRLARLFVCCYWLNTDGDIDIFLSLLLLVSRLASLLACSCALEFVLSLLLLLPLPLFLLMLLFLHLLLPSPTEGSIPMHLVGVYDRMLRLLPERYGTDEFPTPGLTDRAVQWSLCRARGKGFGGG